MITKSIRKRKLNNRYLIDKVWQDVNARDKLKLTKQEKKGFEDFLEKLKIKASFHMLEVHDDYMYAKLSEEVFEYHVRSIENIFFDVQMINSVYFGKNQSSALWSKDFSDWVREEIQTELGLDGFLFIKEMILERLEMMLEREKDGVIGIPKTKYVK